MRFFTSAPDPYVLPEPTDPTILPGWKYMDGLTQVSPALVSNEATAVLLLGGQSNMANYAQTSFTPVNAKVQVLNIYNGGVYQVGAGSLPGAGGILDCWGKRLADKLISSGKYARVILVPIAISSTFFADWAVGGAMNPRIGVAAKRLASLGLPLTYILWGQGESDNVGATSQASCTTSLNSIIATLQQNFGATPIRIASQSYYLGATAANVTNAQAAVLGGTVLPGPNADSLTSGSRYDNIHWNASGADAIASLWNGLLT